MTEEAPVSPKEWLVRIFERGNRATWKEMTTRKFINGPNWFRCADGSVLSVIAGWGTYCSPRPGWPEEWGGESDGYTGPYTAVEVWFPGEDDPRGHVTAKELWEFINEHGGVVAYLPPGETPDKAGWR